MPAPSKTSSDPFALVGSTLGQTYRLEGVIGSSAHGASYTARHVRAPTRCALKLLPPMDSQRRAALADHLGRCAGLAHPRLSLVYDVLELPDGQLALCSPLLDGEDLATRVGLRGKLTRAEGLLVARQAAGALQALHKHGLAHGNLTLRNVFLARYDDVAVDDALGESKGAYGVRLLDIGLHLCDGAQAAPADDQRALAVLLSENVADLTVSQQRALQRAQAAQPQRRFASMQDFWQAFDGAESRAAMATEVKRKRPGDPAASTATAVVPRSRGPVLALGPDAAADDEERPPSARLSLAVVAVAAAVALMMSIVAVRLYRYALHRRSDPAALASTATSAEAHPVVSAAADERAAAVPAAATVTLRFKTLPAGAQVQVNGAAISDGELRIARGQRALTVVATAPGYLDYRDSVVPDMEKTVEIALLRESSAPGSAKDRRRRHHHGKRQP